MNNGWLIFLLVLLAYGFAGLDDYTNEVIKRDYYARDCH